MQARLSDDSSFCLNCLGEVIGISNGNADKERRTIDAAMKDLQPPVFPQDYRLEYCDIYDEQNNKISRTVNL